MRVEIWSLYSALWRPLKTLTCGGMGVSSGENGKEEAEV